MGSCALPSLSSLLGSPSVRLLREPNLVIRFTDHWPVPQLTYLGLNATAFSGDDFYLLDDQTGEVVASIPFDTIGHRCELRCRRGAGAIPFLAEIINLTLLRNGYVPIHASAFLYEGQGILVTGWTKGGKTETLLAFARHGAHYVGDEWVALSADGASIFGLAVPVTIWDWQLVQMTALIPPIHWVKRSFFQGVHLFASIQQKLARAGLGTSLPMRLLTKALPRLQQQLKGVGPPQQFFGEQICAGKVPLDRVILAMSHSSPQVTVEACAAQQIAKRMHHTNRYERWYFLKHYHAFKFAFPSRSNLFLEEIDDVEQRHLASALAAKAGYLVMHPYPVSLEALYQELRPYCLADEVA